MIGAAPTRRRVLVTHDGKFHGDEVFAYATLRLALGLADGDHHLVRTRNPATIVAADIVWDVGSSFDPAASRFDHHQRGAPVRPDGTPFSAAGLVWQVHGVGAVQACGIDIVTAERIATVIDQTVVRSIDRIDNGLASGSDPLGYSALVDDLNPPWDRPRDPGEIDRRFRDAAGLASSSLCRRIDALRATFAAEDAVRAALVVRADPRVLVLERSMPWKRTVLDEAPDVLFCVSPGSSGNWTVYATPTAPGALQSARPLPESWAGLEGAALAAASGVPDAVFVHLRRFMGAARSREGALRMAAAALAAG